ncbi:hypothetical protein EVAR_27658_1 [Eumeta japonica]|uniref:Uncharacterized protein n=1 Tax=Eumeta variegata TaxID=151549 RepID=A0A4C1V2C5_EUMVA|nr:hypothetical protein EVAR_27658_1 [Eumeta japonica]
MWFQDDLEAIRAVLHLSKFRREVRDLGALHHLETMDIMVLMSSPRADAVVPALQGTLDGLELSRQVVSLSAS